jgi:hypothetical protein
VLANNVGAVRMRTEGFLGTSDEDFAWAMQMNFFIALRASRAALTAALHASIHQPGIPVALPPAGMHPNYLCSPERGMTSPDS